MIVQNSTTPWVALILLIMVGCAVLGMMLGNIGPFNTSVDLAKEQLIQTQASISTIATANNLDQQNQFQDRIPGFVVDAMIVMTVVIVSAWIATRLFVQITVARIQEKTAQAQLLAEQRRLVALRADLRMQKNRRLPLPPDRTSSAEDPGNEDVSPGRNE